MNKKYIWFAVVVVIILLAVWFNSYNPQAGVPASDIVDGVPAETTTTVPSQPSVSVGTTKEFTVTGNNFAFAPKVLTVNKGDTVKITFVNSGGSHDLRIDEFAAATKVIKGGAQETITFVADKTGSFEYYCSVGSHRAMGMKGTLTVQ